MQCLVPDSRTGTQIGRRILAAPQPMSPRRDPNSPRHDHTRAAATRRPDLVGDGLDLLSAGPAYQSMLIGMSTERITISLPSEVKQAAQRVAEASGVALSSLVSEAINSWLRTRLVDSWLIEHQAEFGEFDESELQALAADVGVPYLPPRRRESAA